MKTRAIVLAAILAVAAGSPALAKSQKAVQNFRHSQALIDARAAVAAPDAYGVYVDGKEVGRDPDANIRQSISNEYHQVLGH
jgi:hypothetical protein